MPIRSFTPHIPQIALDDLQARLQTVRWPDSLDPDSWEDGSSLSFMQRLVDHWLRQLACRSRCLDCRKASQLE